MATLLNSETRRLYSWWWDSHISPKNSKWLQENLTDMDAKVKAMIKLIEEDADSFARRAEMYYKKRPELMKLVEEFYRAYRALAERYDHATVELRQAHRTMAEAFPNDIPYVLADNSPSGSSGPEAEPHTPEMPHPNRALLDPDDLHKDALGVSSTSSHAIQTRGRNSEEFESRLIKSGLKQLNVLFGSRDLVPPQLSVAEGRMRKGLSVHEPEKSEENLKDMLSQISSENQKLKSQAFSESQHPGKTENEVQTLKKVLLEIQAEKEAVHDQYGESLEKLSHLGRELDHAQKDAGGLDERASKAEIEIKILKEALVDLESERDAGLLQYSQSLQRISILKNKLSVAQEETKGLDDRAVTAENENQHLKQELSRLEAEKEAGLRQYKQYLEKISILETKISLAEENARVLNEQIERTETEVKALKKALTKQNEEKEATALQYKHCLEIIAKMESELCHAQEDAKRLNSEVLLGAAKLKSAEEQCLLVEKSNQSLQLEASNLVQKIALKDQELSEKHHELEKLQTLMQVEHSRFKQAEATLQALQTIHSQSQEEQIALTLELKNGLQMLKDLENCRHGMEEQLQKVKEEKRSLNELNFSSTISINNLQNEVFSLKAMKEKLEEEVALKADQSNTLQQEIYHLKEELKGLNGRYQAIMEQVEAVGLNPECIESYVKDLQDENSKLKEACKMERDEREALHETLKHMDKLLKENAVMESSLLELSSELAGLREKAKNFQESCQFLHEDRSTLVAEKATLLSQLQIITENMQKLLEKNTLLDNSLSGAKVELEGFRAKSKSLEELCQLLSNEKSNLLNERRSLEFQLENVEQRLGDLEKRFSRLEEKYSHVEKEKEVTLFQVVELQGSLSVEKQERASYVQSCEARLAGLESQVHIMQEESKLGKKVFEDELDRAVIAQVEIFVLQRFIEDLEERNLSLVIEFQKFVEASKVSDKLITELECENLEQQVEAEFLLDEIQKLRMIIHQLFRAIQIDPNNRYAGKTEQEHITVPDILVGIEDLKDSLLRSKDEKQQLLVENSVVLTLLGQLGLEGAELKSEKKSIENEFEVVTEQCAMLQKNNQELVEMNMQLRMEMGKSGQREDVLKEELEILCVKLRNLEVAYLALQDENFLLLEEKKALLQRFSNVNKEKQVLEEENSFILHETVAFSNLSVVFESFAIEKSVELESLTEKISSLHMVNTDLKTEVGMLGKKMEMKEAENQHLGESVENLGRELNEAKDLSDLFYNQISIGEEFLRQKAIQLSEAEQKLKAIENMNDELCRTVEELKMECEESRSIRENIERQVLEVLEDCKIQKKEIASLREENEILESEVGTLHKEIVEHRIREENLSSELQEQRDEFQLWEAEAATFYFDLQISSIHEVLLENKVQELAGVCEILEDETAVKSVEMEQMKERVSFLESEIREAKTQLSAYVPVIASLGDDIASLEHNALLHTKLFIAVNPEEKDKEMAIHLHEKTCRELTKERATVKPDGIPDLQKIQTRIKAVEKVVVEEMERLATQESIKTNFEEEDVMKKTAEFTLKSTSHQEKDIGKEEMPLGDDLAGGLVLQKTTPEDGTLLKDIQLDQVSDSSFYGRNNRDNGRANDQMLELWEAAEQDDSHHPTVDEKPKQASPQVEGVECQKIEDKEEKSQGPSSELQVEKELGIDKGEVSTTVGEQNQGGYKGKILERLTSDALKLTSLQATLQNLKKKMETNKRSKRVNEIEYENVKRRLQEVEEAVLQLVDPHDNLTKQVEESPSSSNMVPSELEEAGNVCRNSVTEQAQKESEKIERLQFELQNIEYVLLKLEDGKKNKGKYRFLKSKTGILLRDFIHSEGRTRARRKKKACFCGCTKPLTNGD